MPPFDKGGAEWNEVEGYLSLLLKGAAEGWGF